MKLSRCKNAPNRNEKAKHCVPAVQSTIGLPHSDPKYTLDMWMALWQYSSRAPWRLSYTPEGQYICTCSRGSILSRFTSCEEASKNYLVATEKPKNLNPSVHVSLDLIYICVCGGGGVCVRVWALPVHYFGDTVPLKDRSADPNSSGMEIQQKSASKWCHSNPNPTGRGGRGTTQILF